MLCAEDGGVGEGSGVRGDEGVGGEIPVALCCCIGLGSGPTLDGGSLVSSTLVDVEGSGCVGDID